jgi:hypothetical protein
MKPPVFLRNPGGFFIGTGGRFVIIEIPMIL